MKNYIFICILFIISCQEEKNVSSKTIEIDLNKIDRISIFEIFSHINLIPLETTSESLISEIEKVILHDGTFYILDRKQSVVFLFTQTGKYITKIDRNGRGAGEYSYVYDMVINKYDNTLDILDPMGSLLSFDLQGNYINSLRLPSFPKSYKELSYINKDSILFYSIQGKNLLYLYSRKENKILSDFFLEKDEFGPYKPILSFFEYNDSTYFSRSLSDIVYVFNKNKMNIAYEWHTGSDKYNPEKIILPSPDKSIKDIMNESASIPYRYGYNMQNNNYLFASIAKNNKIMSIFHKKAANQNFVFHKTTEDIIFMPHIINDTIALSKIDSGFSLSDFINENVLDEKNKIILNSLTEDANPVLIEYVFNK